MPEHVKKATAVYVNNDKLRFINFELSN